MKHLAKFSLKENTFTPYHVQCSCGVAGSFKTQSEGIAYMEQHFNKLRGVAYGEFEMTTLEAGVEGPPRPKETPEVWKQPKQENPKVPTGKRPERAN